MCVLAELEAVFQGCDRPRATVEAGPQECYCQERNTDLKTTRTKGMKRC